MRGTEAKPRWFMVHVEYRKKLTKPVTLKELQKYSENDGVLANMQELKAARLSVSKVTMEEWTFITEQLVDGYEHEVDGFPSANGEHAGTLPNGNTATPNAERLVFLSDGTLNPDIMQTIESDPATAADNTSLAPDTAATSSRPASRAGL